MQLHISAATVIASTYTVLASSFGFKPKVSAYVNKWHVEIYVNIPDPENAIIIK